jgi:hypothetical protein
MLWNGFLCIKAVYQTQSYAKEVRVALAETMEMKLQGARSARVKFLRIFGISGPRRGRASQKNGSPCCARPSTMRAGGRRSCVRRQANGRQSNEHGYGEETKEVAEP